MKHFILAAILLFGLVGSAHAYGPYVGFSISTGIPLPQPSPPPPPAYYGYAPGYYPEYGYGYYPRSVPPPYYYKHKHKRHHRGWD